MNARDVTPQGCGRPVQYLYRLGSVRELEAWRGFVVFHSILREWSCIQKKGNSMPLVDIQLIEGVFDAKQKQEMIAKVTDAMVKIEGESMRGVTWVRVHEVASGEWGIGGKGITAADVKAMQRAS